MKKILLSLVVICGVWMTGCATSRVTAKTDTFKTLDVPVTVEALPITADLAVSEQKVRGEAKGFAADRELLLQEAAAKALGQDPPNVEGADVLVAREEYTETTDGQMTAVVTGYPAWYRNFRTVAPEDGDSAWLLILGKQTGGCCGTGAAAQPSTGAQLSIAMPSLRKARAGGGGTATKSNAQYYVTPRYLLVGAFDVEGGVVWPNGYFVGTDYGVGYGFGEFTSGVAFNTGSEFDVGNDVKIGGGGSLGFWVHGNSEGVFGYFVTVRWNNFELVNRGLFSDGYIHQIMLGYRFVFGK